MSGVGVFASFDGSSKACIKYAKAKGGMYRCVKFQAGKRRPVCGPLKNNDLRSQFAIRGNDEPCTGGSNHGASSKKKAPKRKSPKTKRSNKR